VTSDPTTGPGGKARNVGDGVDLPDLADLARSTVLLREFMDASRELTARISRRLGMGATDVVALYLLELHGPLGVAELAHRLDIRTASATVLVDRLVAAGHVDRVAHPSDRRRTSVALRESARRANLAAWLPAITAIDEVAHSLSARDQRVVSDFLARVTAAIGEQPAQAGD
jgi:DNA-binding MarR family transcriptional regulator